MKTEHSRALAVTVGSAFSIGEEVEAAHDLSTGFLQPGIACRAGTRLRVLGKSGNGLHPISVCKVGDDNWKLAVSENELRKPNNRSLP